MPVVSKLNYLRITPRKVRLIADLIRKKKVDEAEMILNFAKKGGTKPLLKLLKTALADARNNFQLDPSNLYISKITVDDGPKYKRWMPRARGAAYEIQKKTSHITLVLDEIAPGKKVKKVKKEKRAKEIHPVKSPKGGISPKAKLFNRVKKPPVVTERREAPGEIRKEETPKTERPKLKPETETPKPKTTKGLKRIFRRKAF